jgi:hypothetical protein
MQLQNRVWNVYLYVLLIRNQLSTWLQNRYVKYIYETLQSFKSLCFSELLLTEEHGIDIKMVLLAICCGYELSGRGQ